MKVHLRQLGGAVYSESTSPVWQPTSERDITTTEALPEEWGVWAPHGAPQLAGLVPERCTCALSPFSHVRLFATVWIVPCQAPLCPWILQARILKWLAMPSSRGSFHTRDWTHIPCVSCIGRWILYHWCHLGSPAIDRTSQKNQQRHIKTEQHYQPTEANQHLQNTHLTTTEYTFYSSAHEIYTKTTHILGHRTNLNKCKITEITQTMLSNYNGIKLQ